MYSFWLQPMAGDHFGSLATGMLLKITMLSPATSNIGNQGHFHFNF